MLDKRSGHGLFLRTGIVLVGLFLSSFWSICIGSARFRLVENSLTYNELASIEERLMMNIRGEYFDEFSTLLRPLVRGRPLRTIPVQHKVFAAYQYIWSCVRFAHGFNTVPDVYVITRFYEALPEVLSPDTVYGYEEIMGQIVALSARTVVDLEAFANVKAIKDFTQTVSERYKFFIMSVGFVLRSNGVGGSSIVEPRSSIVEPRPTIVEPMIAAFDKCAKAAAAAEGLDKSVKETIAKHNLELKRMKAALAELSYTRHEWNLYFLLTMPDSDAQVSAYLTEHAKKQSRLSAVPVAAPLAAHGSEDSAASVAAAGGGGVSGGIGQSDSETVRAPPTSSARIGSSQGASAESGAEGDRISSRSGEKSESEMAAGSGASDDQRASDGNGTSEGNGFSGDKGASEDAPSEGKNGGSADTVSRVFPIETVAAMHLYLKLRAAQLASIYHGSSCRCCENAKKIERAAFINSIEEYLSPEASEPFVFPEDGLWGAADDRFPFLLPAVQETVFEALRAAQKHIDFLVKSKSRVIAQSMGEHLELGRQLHPSIHEKILSLINEGKVGK